MVLSPLGDFTDNSNTETPFGGQAYVIVSAWLLQTNKHTYLEFDIM